MPDWLLWLWLIPTIIFSFIGEGAVSFLLIRLIYLQWFKVPDTTELRISQLEVKTFELAQERDALIKEKNDLLSRIFKLLSPTD